MNIIRIKVLLSNILKIKPRNWFITFTFPGHRNKSSSILAEGQFFFIRKKNAKINIEMGDLTFNHRRLNPEPYVGVLKMMEDATINVSKGFSIFGGHHIILMKDAKLNLGSGYINRNVKIRCFKEISIGENVAISENVTMWDTDAHTIVGKENEITKPIKIGNHVWIGNNVTILKGVTIGDGAIIAAGSVVTRNIPEKCLAGGVPAKVIKENVDWN